MEVNMLILDISQTYIAYTYNVFLWYTSTKMYPGIITYLEWLSMHKMLPTKNFLYTSYNILYVYNIITWYTSSLGWNILGLCNKI